MKDKFTGCIIVDNPIKFDSSIYLKSEKRIKSEFSKYKLTEQDT